MSVRNRIVDYVTRNNDGYHTNASLAAELQIPEPSVRRATREAVDFAEIRISGTKHGFTMFMAVPSPAPVEPTDPTVIQ